MPNMSLKKNPMPEQAPDVRNKNFEEVALGYTAEMAVDEAKRCLHCKTGRASRAARSTYGFRSSSRRWRRGILPALTGRSP